MTLFRGYGGDLPLMRWLQEKIWPVEAKLEAEDVYWGARLACVEMIRTGTARFWDMYWHPEATARAVRDAGLRATIGGPLFDAEGGTEEMKATALREPRGARRARRRRSSRRWRRTRSTPSARSCCAGPPRPPPSAASRSRSTSPRPSPRSSGCLERHGVRPAAYLDRARPARRAHGARPRRLARPRGAGADRRARLHRRHQPGRQHEARGRRHLPLPGRPRGGRRGRARHRRRRLQRLARPARRPQGLRPGPAPRGAATRPCSAPPRPGRSRPAPRSPLLRGAGRAARGRRRRPTSSSCAATPTSSASATSTPTSSTRPRGSVVDTTVVGGRVLMRGGEVEGAAEVLARAAERAARLGIA